MPTRPKIYTEEKLIQLLQFLTLILIYKILLQRHHVCIFLPFYSPPFTGLLSKTIMWIENERDPNSTLNPFEDTTRNSSFSSHQPYSPFLPRATTPQRKLSKSLRKPSTTQTLSIKRTSKYLKMRTIQKVGTRHQTAADLPHQTFRVFSLPFPVNAQRRDVSSRRTCRPSKSTVLPN